jgi:hypothetical protein
LIDQDALKLRNGKRWVCVVELQFLLVSDAHRKVEL